MKLKCRKRGEGGSKAVASIRSTYNSNCNSITRRELCGWKRINENEWKKAFILLILNNIFTILCWDLRRGCWRWHKQFSAMFGGKTLNSSHFPNPSSHRQNSVSAIPQHSITRQRNEANTPKNSKWVEWKKIEIASREN